MENIQFENRVEDTEELAKSRMRLFQKLGGKRRHWYDYYKIISLVSLGVSAAVAALQSNHIMMYYFVCILCIICIFHFAGPAISARRYWKQYAEQNGERICRRTVIFGDGIEVQSGNTTIIHTYDNIRFIVENEEHFCLFVGINSMIVIYKNAFTVGNADAFSAFINEKCSAQEPLWTKSELNKRITKKRFPKIIYMFILTIVLLLYFWSVALKPVPITVSESSSTLSPSVNNVSVNPEFITINLSRRDITSDDLEEMIANGSIPRNVAELILVSTQISDLTPLQSLTDLVWLFLPGTQVSDLTPLQSLTDLRILSLSNTQVSDLTPLQSLTNLVDLDLAHTQINDLTPLQSLSNLGNLDISNTQVKDLRPIQSLLYLEKLNLNRTQISDLTPLQRMASLKWLNLSYTQIRDLASVQALTELVILELSNTRINDLTPLQSLTNLEKLDLAETQISDLTPLQSLTKLEWLDLFNTQTHDDRISELHSKLPKCAIYPLYPGDSIHIVSIMYDYDHLGKYK